MPVNSLFCCSVTLKAVAIRTTIRRYSDVMITLRQATRIQDRSSQTPLSSLMRVLSRVSRRPGTCSRFCHSPGDSLPSKYGSYPANEQHSKRSASARTSPGTCLRVALRPSARPFTTFTTFRCISGSFSVFSNVVPNCLDEGPKLPYRVASAAIGK